MSTTQTGSNAAIDYRYIGKDPDNYVCLEEDGECEEDELYRIIGIIPTQKEVNGEFEYRVKLIKSTNYAGSKAESSSYAQGGLGYRWSGSRDNKSSDWTASTLNTEILNGAKAETEDSYWDSISDYNDYIDDTIWYLGAQAAKEHTPQNFYINERGTARGSADGLNNYRTKAKIGLMYPSDYGYATSGGSEEKRSECLSSIFSSDWGSKSDGLCAGNDWLYDGYYQWTITTDYDTSGWVWGVASGQIGYNTAYYVIWSVRPVFHLASNVNYLDGTGSHDDPYLISL